MIFQNFPSQITLEEFKLGRFESHHHRGCPDGHLQIVDGHRRGGQFCGSIALGGKRPKPVFVSESGAVTATIRFYHFYNGNQQRLADDNFSFTMRYKFLSNETAAARCVLQISDMRRVPGCVNIPRVHLISHL